MTKRLSRIAPWQAAKLFAVVYFLFSLLFIVPMILFALFAPGPPGPGPRLGPGMLAVLPFLYALAALIFVPLGCAIYNLAARLVGGLKVSVTDEVDP